MRPDDHEPVDHRFDEVERAREAVPEPIGENGAERAIEPTGEVSMLPPEEASKVAAEIRAVAEMRGQDFGVVELAELQKTGPLPIIAQPIDDDALSADELRDAWPLLDLEERSDGLRVLPREDAEDYFIALSATDQAALLVHFRPGQRRQWMRLLEPDDVADVIQHAGDQHRQTQDKTETIYYAYVVDPDHHLLGVVSFRDLFATDPKRIVADFMETDV